MEMKQIRILEDRDSTRNRYIVYQNRELPTCIESADCVKWYIYLKGIRGPACREPVLKKRFRDEYKGYVKRSYMQ